VCVGGLALNGLNGNLSKQKTEEESPSEKPIQFK